MSSIVLRTAAENANQVHAADIADRAGIETMEPETVQVMKAFITGVVQGMTVETTGAEAGDNQLICLVLHIMRDPDENE
jgi:hypothetical protein